MIDMSLYEKYLELKPDGCYYVKEGTPDWIASEIKKIDSDYYDVYKEHLVSFDK